MEATTDPELKAVLAHNRDEEKEHAEPRTRAATPAQQLAGVLKAVHRSPVVTGGVVCSTRGGDFIRIVGGDLVVGYRRHDEAAIHLFCVESIAVQLRTPAVGCVLRAPGRAGTGTSSG